MRDTMRCGIPCRLVPCCVGYNALRIFGAENLSVCQRAWACGRARAPVQADVRALLDTSAQRARAHTADTSARLDALEAHIALLRQASSSVGGCTGEGGGQRERGAALVDVVEVIRREAARAEQLIVLADAMVRRSAAERTDAAGEVGRSHGEALRLLSQLQLAKGAWQCGLCGVATCCPLLQLTNGAMHCGVRCWRAQCGLGRYRRILGTLRAKHQDRGSVALACVVKGNKPVCGTTALKRSAR